MRSRPETSPCRCGRCKRPRTWETLAGSVDRSNSMWVSDYMSTQQAGSYARSYTFTVDTATHVAINLTSPEDSYLYVLDSSGMQWSTRATT